MQAQPTIAMMYDFDKTLTTKDMQEYTFIPKLGLSSEEFWKKANDQARGEGMDSILSYLKLMLDEAKRCNQPIRRSDLVDLGRDLQFYPGVEGWFSSINAVGEELGLSFEPPRVSRRSSKDRQLGRHSGASMPASISMMLREEPFGPSYR
jgi:hypothetical protein